jgi:hypothetical protein
LLNFFKILLNLYYGWFILLFLKIKNYKVANNVTMLSSYSFLNE